MRADRHPHLQREQQLRHGLLRPLHGQPVRGGGRVRVRPGTGLREDAEGVAVVNGKEIFDETRCIKVRTHIVVAQYFLIVDQRI